MAPLRVRLRHVAALALLGACKEDSVAKCPPDEKTVDVTPDVACAIAATSPDGISEPNHSVFQSQKCNETCGTRANGLPYGICRFPEDYAATFTAAVDGGSRVDAGVCPTTTAGVTITCLVDCTGRLTDGVPAPAIAGRDAGSYFARCAYLEAVSALAFARFARELEAHGAPAELVAWAVRAEREEERHAEATSALAAFFGAGVSSAPAAFFGAGVSSAPAPPPSIRSLFAIARENAVEGCVRETYGAALAVARAELAARAEVRETLRVIAVDECGHAELAWAVHAWVMPRLDAEERDAIDDAMRAAAQTLGGDDLTPAARAESGMPDSAVQRRLAALLETHVLRAA